MKKVFSVVDIDSEFYFFAGRLQESDLNMLEPLQTYLDTHDEGLFISIRVMHYALVSSTADVTSSDFVNMTDAELQRVTGDFANMKGMFIRLSDFTAIRECRGISPAVEQTDDIDSDKAAVLEAKERYTRAATNLALFKTLKGLTDDTD